MDDLENKKNIDENEAFAEDLFKAILPDPEEEATKKKTSLYGQFESTDETSDKTKERTVSEPISAQPIMLDIHEVKDDKHLDAKKITILYLVLLAVIIVLSVLIGVRIEKIVEKVRNNSSKSTSVVDFTSDGLSEEEVAKFQTIYNFIQEYYYKSIDPNKLIEGAIEGMVDSIEDPYGKYYIREQMDKYVDMVDAKDEDGEKQQTVTYAELEGYVKYIKISKFAPGTAEEFREAVDMAASEYCKGIVIDLRDCPGGYADEATNVCDIILPKGVIATAKNKDGVEELKYESDANEISVPVVLLVNGNTASAAELVTGAFKDFEKGEIIGTKTFGKALGQLYKQFESDGSGIVLSSYTYYTPSGKCIDGIGIEPTMVVENDDTIEGDEQLTAAIQVILGTEN